jgi:hypothetical protein
MSLELDDAIKHAEEEAKKQEELYRSCPASESIFHCDGTKDCKILENGKNKGCQKCANEYRQLATWLKDYKRMLQESTFDNECQKEMEEIREKEKIEHNPCETCGYAEGSPYCLQYCPYDAERTKEQEPKQQPIREFTPEEAKAYSASLDKMYKPTGFNVFNDPCDDTISKRLNN